MIPAGSEAGEGIPSLMDQEIEFMKMVRPATQKGAQPKEKQ